VCGEADDDRVRTARLRFSSRGSLMASRSSRAITRAALAGSAMNARRNMTRHMPMNTMRRMTTMGARLRTKSLKVSPARLAMMMFGGSPIRVAVPPMLLAMTSASR
jgi:hypothetical protein